MSECGTGERVRAAGGRPGSWVPPPPAGMSGDPLDPMNWDDLPWSPDPSLPPEPIQHRPDLPDGLPSLCRCSHIKDAHYARKPGGYDLCQAPGCFCVEYLP